jgi:hypothetical protein
MKVKLTRQEINWIERTADIETSRIFIDFEHLLNSSKLCREKDIDKTLLNKQTAELIELYTFLKTLRAKLELWDCRYDIDTELELKDKTLEEKEQ